MAWWVWLIVALVLGIVELLGTTFVLMWIAIASAVTAVLAAFSANLWLQVAVFAVTSSVLLAVTRPLVRRWRSGASVSNQSDRMVGQTGVVVTPPRDQQLGTVRIHGEVWSASSAQPLTEDERVIVLRADSSVLEVAGAQDE